MNVIANGIQIVLKRDIQAANIPSVEVLSPPLLPVHIEDHIVYSFVDSRQSKVSMINKIS